MCPNLLSPPPRQTCGGRKGRQNGHPASPDAHQPRPAPRTGGEARPKSNSGTGGERGHFAVRYPQRARNSSIHAEGRFPTKVVRLALAYYDTTSASGYHVQVRVVSMPTSQESVAVPPAGRPT